MNPEDIAELHAKVALIRRDLREGWILRFPPLAVMLLMLPVTMLAALNSSQRLIVFLNLAAFALNGGSLEHYFPQWLKTMIRLRAARRALEEFLKEAECPKP